MLHIARSHPRVWYIPNVIDEVWDPVPDEPDRIVKRFNRMDPEPFAVLIEAMTGREAMEMQRRLGVISRGSEVNPVSKSIEARDALIEERVIEVVNFSVQLRDGSRTLEPRNGKELVEAVYEAGGSDPTMILGCIAQAIEDRSHLVRGLRDLWISRLKRLSEERARSSVGAVDGAGGPSAQAPS